MMDRVRTFHSLVPVFPVTLVLAAVSWAGPVPAPRTQRAEAEAAEIGNYKLTLATMDKVEKAFRGFSAAAEADPALGARLDALEPPDRDAESAVVSIDDAVRQMEEIPQFVKVVKGVGVTMREVLLFSYVFAGTMIASSMSQGDAPSAPDSAPALADNVRWFRENQVPIRGFLAQMEQLSQDEEAREGAPDAWSGGDADSVGPDGE